MYHLYVPMVYKLWEPKHLGAQRSCPGLQLVSFTLYFPSWTIGYPHRCLQVTDSSTLHIMCDGPNTAVFCSESIECFLLWLPNISAKPLLLFWWLLIITGITIHFFGPHSYIFIHKLLDLIYFLLPFAWHLSAGVATSISMQGFSACFLIIKSGLFFVTSLSVLNSWFHNAVTSSCSSAGSALCVCVFVCLCVCVFHFPVISMPSALHIE